jgi:hypothetical protein
VDTDLYLNTTNGDVYQKAAGVWGVVDNITGPTGANGANGAAGAAGAAGADFAAAYATLAYGAGTVDIDLTNVNTYRQITLTGNLILTTSNRAAARNKVVFIVGDGSIRNLTFPAGWTFVNASGMPATIAANKTAVLSIVCRDGNDSGVLAVYTEQP